MKRAPKALVTALWVATAAVAVTTSLAGCDENILDPMADRQPKVKPYKESAFYDDGLAMRAPPEGTVPRERSRLSPMFTAGRGNDVGPFALNGEPVNGGYATAIPLPVNAKLLAVGRKRFDITCATCHGPLGDGDSIVARQMSLRPPPTLHKYADRPPGYIFEVITKGFGLMASYAAELTIEERWAVVAYVRALQISQNVPVDNLPADVRARLMAQPEGAAASGPAAPAPSPPAHKETP
ncbi:MAG TPA: cytochrome c [Polyangia bacterium]|nr:cytochrome c [Polyangia bacterium]